jgi:SAM-dependent methyltransferase
MSILSTNDFFFFHFEGNNCLQGRGCYCLWGGGCILPPQTCSISHHSIMPALPHNPVSTWSDYYACTIGKPLHPLFSTLEPHLSATGRAIDLGCGVGHAVVWLAEKGWKVEAVDGHAEGLEILKSRLTEEQLSRIKLTESSLEHIHLPENSFDLAIGAYSLFFIDTRENFDRLWSNIRNALKPGGLFIGEFLGPHDDWAEKMITHDRAQVDQLLAGMDVLHLEEADQEGQTSMGTDKHWHVFHIIARK